MRPRMIFNNVQLVIGIRAACTGVLQAAHQGASTLARACQSDESRLGSQPAAAGQLNISVISYGGSESCSFSTTKARPLDVSDDQCFCLFDPSPTGTIQDNLLLEPIRRQFYYKTLSQSSCIWIVLFITHSIRTSFTPWLPRERYSPSRGRG